MSKWLTVARSASPDLFVDDADSKCPDDVPMPRANSANSANRSEVQIGKTAENCLMAQTALTATGTVHEKTLAGNSLAVVCIFCGEPVERGTPGTGALAGKDLHMDCYRKRYPKGHQRGDQNPASRPA